jgi:hypothetical protein
MAALKKAALELGRVVVLAIIPLAISYFEQGIGIDWRAIAIIAGLAALRFVDKWLHELAPDGEAGGLVRF